MRFSRVGFLCLLACLYFTLSATAQEVVPSDSSHGDLFLVADSLNAQYAGRGLPDSRPPAQGITGRFQFGRSLTPLNHPGKNVFQDVAETPPLINAIRQFKSDPTWSPYDPGQVGHTAYDYQYNQDGAEQVSYFARLFLEQPLQGDRRTGFRIDSRYDFNRGPFPNQRSSALDVYGQFIFRLSPSQQISLDLLGMDNGWHLNRGNRVFTDRARYMLEQLNTWRVRTGGIELTWQGEAGPKVSYRIYSRLLSRQWASDPPDPSQIRTPAPGEVLPVTQPQPAGTLPENALFINQIYPVVSTVVSASARTMRSFENGAELAYKVGENNLITLGIETQFHRQAFYNHWQTATLLDQYDLAIHPREISLYFFNRFRFWRLMMATGLRYDWYHPGTSDISNLLRTTVDTRAVQGTGQQLLTSSGSATSLHLLNPHFSVAYPADKFTAHLLFGISSRSFTLADRYGRTGTPYADQSIPALRPRRTTSLELGIGTSQSAYTTDVTWFYRDTERYDPLFGPDVLPQTVSNYAGSWGRINTGWHGQQGIEASYVRRSSPIGRAGLRLSGRLSYLYLFDLGDVRRADLPVAPDDPLNPGDLTAFDVRVNDFWNRRHWISANASLRFSSGTTITLLGHMQSGVPYRGSTSGISGTRTQHVLSGPWMRRVDGRIDVPIRIGQDAKAVLFFIEGRNLTNHTIIEVITDPVSFAATGQPDNDTVRQTQWVYGPARSVWTGFGVSW